MEKDKNVKIRKIKKLFMIMKLITALLLIGTLQISANTFSQDVRLSLNMKDGSLAEFFKEVELKTNYSIFYKNELLDLSQKLQIVVKDAPLAEVLTKALAGQNASFKIIDKVIVITPKTVEQLTLTGKVIDKEQGQPLPGVSIMIQETKEGTITDLDGNYTLKLPSTDVTVVFSFIGYKPQTIALAGKTTLNVTMEEETKGLEEVVVVGYGAQNKKLITGSIGSVNMADNKLAPNQMLASSLQGKTAGVLINQNSGTPGGGISVRIRGNSSVTAGNTPLYVIDGIPVTTGDYSQVSFSGQGINALSDLNPNEIESISILRDAAATSIYGARGSNGVVLITTKKGISDKTRVEFSAYTGLQSQIKPFEVLNARQFKEFKNELVVSEGGLPIYSQENIDKNEVDVDWLDQILRVAPISNYDISVSGGNAKTKVFVAGTIFNQDGIVLGTSYKRYNGRVNLDHAVNDKLKFTTKYALSFSKNKRVEGDQSLNGPLPNAMTLPSIYPIYRADGSYDESGPYANPVAIATEASNEANSYRNITDLAGEYIIVPGLVFKTKLGIDYLNLNEHSYDPVSTRQGARYKGAGIESNSNVLNIIHSDLLTYTKSFANTHNLDVLLGFSMENYRRVSDFIRGSDFPSEEFEYLVSASTITSAQVRLTERRLNSYFTSVNYNYKYKYLFTFNARYDGSSKFGENNKYGFFPSASLGWRVSEEEFLKGVKSISDLKFRVSYGLSGNDQIPDFRSLALYAGGGNYLGESGIIPLQLPNPDLKWESTSQFDAGFDLGLFEDRITLSVDVYMKKTTDMLLSRPISLTSGYSSITSNMGELSNKGIEFILNTINIQRTFSWSTTLNFSANRNEVLKLYNHQPIDNVGRGSNRVEEGEPIGIFYGYLSLGVDPSTGDLRFKDVSGDGQITSADRTKIGDPNPLFTGGLTNNLGYKGFSLNFFIQYSYGNDIFNGTRRYTESLGLTPDNQSIAVLDRWKNPGDRATMPRATSTDPNGNNRISSRFIEDGSYLRLKNVSLSYSFRPETIKRMRISSLRVYCTVQNLYTFTKYTGMDPEVNYAGDSNLIMGTDFFTYPQARTVTFGVNMGI